MKISIFQLSRYYETAVIVNDTMASTKTKITKENQTSTGNEGTILYDMVETHL